MSDHDWHTEDFPELRAGPPWVMQEMIAAQPAVVEALLSSPPPDTRAAAEAIAAALEDTRPVTVCGCGTSEHAAHAIAALLSAAVRSGHPALVRARPAMSAALDPSPGVCLAVSHDGGTRATNLALHAARAAGAITIAITNQPGAAVARDAEHLLVTPRHDDSWCHTMAYTSALAAGGALAVHLGGPGAEPAAARELLEHATRLPDAAAVAARLAGTRVVLCAGAQVDHVTARELALKIAEGARLPTIALELETVLHGQLAGHEPADALILVAITDHPERERIARRAALVARAAAAIGLPVAGLLSGAYDRMLPTKLTPAGRLVLELPGPDRVYPRLAGLLAGAGALQTLTLELAHARDTNPDLIRREEARYRQAAHEAESSADW
jgi:glucosamine--fructose-6-phosphate aminotransferase (isomerizing)